MRRALLPLLLAAGCAAPRAAPPPPPVRLYTHGVVHTLDPQWPQATALAVQEGRLVAVGETDALVKKFPDAAVVDLAGRCVMPGLIDAHGHLAALGALKRELDLRDTRSEAEMVERVRARAATLPEGTWILGGRWDQATWGVAALPDNRALSAAVPRHPVLLSRVDGHAALANGAALARAGVTAGTEAPPGGEIVKDADGAPTGLLVDNAVDLVRRAVPAGGGVPTGELWRTAQEACFAVGLTCVHDAGVSCADLDDLRARYARGELKLRVYAMVSDEPGIAGWLAVHPPRSDPRLSVRAVKMYADGAMGSRGAWMLEEYYDRPGHFGLNVTPVDHLRELSAVAAQLGWQACTHAIGDRANREVLDAYAAALEGLPTGGPRFRIEHAQCVSLADLPRFAQLGVIASMQPTHATSDMRWAMDRVGPERLQGCYAWRRLLDTGARLCFGSDFPVESENPLLGVYAAETRQDLEGKPAGGWGPGQRLSRAEAFRLFTRDAAYAAFLEKEIGMLKPGLRADFVVFDRDVMAVPARELPEARVLETVIDGETVFRAPP